MFDVDNLDKLEIAAGQNLKERDYWLEKFTAGVVKTTFPYDHSPVKEDDDRQMGTLESGFPEDLSTRIVQMSNGSDYRLHMILSAGLLALLYRYTGQQDITIGMPIYKEEVAGELINRALALQNHLDEGATFKELLLMVKQTVSEAVEHQAYPIELLPRKLNLPPGGTGFPLFGTVLLLENIQDKTYVQHLDIDILFSFKRNGTNIEVAVLYNPRLYEKESIVRTAGHFKRLLAKSCLDVDQPVLGIELLSEDEKNRLLFDLNDTGAAYPSGKTIHQLFEEQVEKTPGNIAVTAQSSDYSSLRAGSQHKAPGAAEGAAPPASQTGLTYRELNEKANRTAHLLRSRGIGRGSIVGLLLERSTEMIAAILGVLKAGASYLPIDTITPIDRVTSILDDSATPILLTQSAVTAEYPFSKLQSPGLTTGEPYTTAPRPQVKDFDSLPLPDRSLVDNEKYNRHIGMSMVKNCISIQATRGCPYKCLYCHKIWPKTHVFRSAENIFEEVKTYYDMGVRRFSLIDDVFNLNRKNSSRFFKMIIDNGLKVELFFPNGVRGDILTEEYIDLMVQAGTVTIALALETASPRLQTLIGKNLKLERLRRNLEYLCTKYPHVITELFTMHGFPTETEAEAQMTLDFIKSSKWIDFPYVHILKIYPNTDMARMAIEQGISPEAIAGSDDAYYHELPDTLPFEKSFTRRYQAEFLNEYFLSKERLLAVLPYQAKVLTESEIVEKYNSYFPENIETFDQLLYFVGITREELGIEKLLSDEHIYVPDLNKKIAAHFSRQEPAEDALRVLLLDTSLLFSRRGERLNLFEPPLGLINLTTYLHREFGTKVAGRIAKSRVDFDSFSDLKALLEEFKPHIIGMRTLSLYKNFYHETAAMIRQWGFDVPIMGGGPYATSAYKSILQDKNIDLVVLGEGEITFGLLIGEIIKNNNKLPGEEVLKGINGIAFLPQEAKLSRGPGREAIVLDELGDSPVSVPAPEQNPGNINQPSDPAYIIFTSGSTGKPKGVLIEHKNVVRLMMNDKNLFDFNSRDIWTMFHAYNFDFSVWEMYGALLYGGKLVVVPIEITIDPAQFLEILKNEKITVLNQTPSAFYNLASEALKHTPEQLSLRYIIFGGEALNPVKLKGWQEKHPAVKLINMFGITETTVHVTYKEIGAREVQSNTSNIGKPIPTLSAYVMNSHQELLPAGIPGELCVGGLGVGRGYLNRPGLTREKFVPNPYKPGETLYRSGDLVRIHEDGNMDYLGRIDQQVQIRGFRVEPGEIEARLLERENIKEAVVVAVGEEKKDRLCAYIVSDGEIDTAVLREFLQQTLPDYMIPNYFMKVEKIPLTANGKVDRRALPDPEVKPAGEYIPPGSELEEQLVEIWKEVLNLNQVGIKDNYFYVGGDSIVAIRLVSAMNKSLAANLKIADLYTCQTIAGLSRFMQQDKEKSLPDARRETLEKIAGLALRVKAIHPKPEEIEMVFPMGDVQTGMLFYYLKEPAALYHDQISYHVRYEIFDTGKIKQALGLMAQKHPVLRSSFNLEELAQIVHKEPIIALHSYDISHLERAEQEQHVNNYTRENRGKYFDMTVPPLWRLTVFSLGAKNYVICAEVHHVISDGWSNALFFTELNNTYMQLLKEPGFKPAPLKSNYDVYITEQFVEKNKLMAAEKTADYWRNELEDYKRLDFPGAAGETGASPGSEKFVLDLGRSFLEQVNDFAVKNNTQLKNLCFAAYVYMLNMLSYENDLVVGLVANNRPEIEDSDKILGCFLNTIPVRVKTPAGIAWLEYIKEIDRKMLELKKYDKLSLAEIMKITGEKTRDGNPLFDTYFNFVNFYAFKQMDLAGADVYIPDPLKLTDHERTNTIFDFGINITRDSFLILLPYSSEVISGETVENLCGYFREILHRFIENPQGKIDKNSIISKAEKKKLLQDLNRTTAEYPREKTIYRLFREQARKNPENIALSTQNAAQEAGQEPETANCLFTYRELEKKSTRLAYHLKEKGVKPGIIAAVMVERSAAMITALLGILAAGGAYLPIDPAYPADRISYMLADSETKLILTTKRTFGTGEKVGKWTGEKVFLDSPVEVEAGDNFTPDEAGTGLRPAPGPGDPAYAIYTSGSTGKPKGVMIEQRNVVNFISGMTQRIPFEPGSAVLALTTISFDIFVLETLLPLSSGLNVVLATEKHQGDPELLKKFISANNISIMQLTPSRLNMLLGSGKEAGGTTIPAVIRTLIVGGEEFPQDLFQRLKQVFSGRIFNVYGPTETTVWSTIKELTAVEKVTIGTPILNTRIYIVDKNNQMLPFGCTGELCIGGEGVGKGYVNLPATTKEKFFKDPALEEGWIYKTGDLARWLPDGDIEFSGRIDYQVKVRGFRIELEEIESRLLKNDAVEKAVVLARTGKDGDKYLCAYIVAGAEVSVSRLRSYLLEKLPYYMIPSHFIRMDEVPLTQNRKVDRQALLNYEGTKIETGAVYVSPASDLEKEIAHIWEEVLGIKKVGIQDNFFDVGGNSLNIIQVSSRLKQAFQREVPVLTLFEHPTISALLAYIEQDKEEILSKQAKEREALERAGESLEETVQLFDQD